MATFEAAAAGLPIVSTRTRVAPDIVTNGKNGLFVRYWKVDQISNAITKVLMDGNFKGRLKGGRSLILKNYDQNRDRSIRKGLPTVGTLIVNT